MFMGKFYPIKKKFYTDIIHASVTNSMSESHVNPFLKGLLRTVKVHASLLYSHSITKGCYDFM